MKPQNLNRLCHLRHVCFFNFLNLKNAPDFETLFHPVVYTYFAAYKGWKRWENYTTLCSNIKKMLFPDWIVLKIRRGKKGKGKLQALL